MSLQPVLLAAALAAAASPDDVCNDLLPQRTSGPDRQMAPIDLVRVRETGWADGHPGAPPPMAISPDGKQLAIVVRRGDPRPNRHCIGLLVGDLAGRSARLLDVSDELLRDSAPWNGLLDQPSGRPLFNQPKWSPDGGRLYYLRAHLGRAQVWRVDENGGALRVSDAPDGVIHFGLTRDGQRIIYSTRAGLNKAKAEIHASGRNGWVYDGRFAPLVSTMPQPSGIEAVAMSIAVTGGYLRAATSREISESGVRLGEVSDALELASLDPSWKFEMKLVRPDRPFGSSRLRVARRDHELECPDRVCAGRVRAAFGIGEHLLVARDVEGLPGSLELVRWKPGEAWHRLRSGSDILSGCVPATAALICLEEGPALAPRIVRVAISGPTAGTSELILDLNPEFSHLRLGDVRRLRWRDSNGFDAYGDLVLPPEYRPGQKHPLIIVQYQSEGFLRGGSGNEFPIYPLAARGFAVLSINQPRRAIAARGAEARNITEFQAVMYKDLWQRRALLTALDAGIDAALATGFVDPQRIGLTGMSDGASTGAFALLHSPRYKAAALGPGWPEPVTYNALVGPRFGDMVAKWGLPSLDTAATWRELSLARNAERVNVPLQIQTGDAELRGALEAFEALKRGGKPVEMIVYADEYHNKWQPAHLEAMYNACIEWFDFWLNGRQPADRGRANRWLRLANGDRESGSRGGH